MSDPTKSETYVRVMKGLHDRAEAYVRDGVALFDCPYMDYETYRDWTRKNPILCSKHLTRSFLRSIAKDLKRPFVYAARHHTHINLTIPRRKGMDNLVSALLLASEQPPTHSMARVSHAAVVRFPYRNTWTFRFNGEEGRQIFLSFLERCRTDPVFRIVLKTNQ